MANKRHVAAAMRKLAAGVTPLGAQYSDPKYDKLEGARLNRAETRALLRHVTALEARNKAQHMIEGNRGGSFLEMTATPTEGVVNLTLGHDCVYVFNDRPVSVHALCAVLAQAWDAKGGWRQMVADQYGGEVPAWAEPIPGRLPRKEVD
jgi:hypothetical protein